ncbi:hypothetical protein [Noviherbaspirillum galbum]|uniref:Uncharacterized protein n=1 Tax=Noviherbaspirillum galbum TaxID=2709383 RepID=A0A6B3SSG6_9BURK|nr:hypothetical protein [Noviherbaspirillum galbum]NEX61766.1 hypothetical protein [Noviherbaspirillum galbum]
MLQAWAQEIADPRATGGEPENATADGNNVSFPVETLTGMPVDVPPASPGPASGAIWKSRNLDLSVTADLKANARPLLDTPAPSMGMRARYLSPLGVPGTLSGFVGSGVDPAFGPPASGMRAIAGVDSAELRRSPSATRAGEAASVLSVGYAWRNLTLEGSTFTSQETEDRRLADNKQFRLDSSSTRLSYQPVPEWTFQLSRGNLGGQDPLDPYLEIRRTTLSATYRKELQGAQWQTTFAWGRSVRPQGEPTTGYMAESTLHFAGKNAFFGRLEQARSDELMRQNDAMRRELFTTKKLTVGYYHELPPQGTMKVDVGAFASRYVIPSYATSSYGSAPMSFMVFLRARYQ